MATTTSNIIDLAEYRRKLNETQTQALELEPEWDQEAQAVPLPPHPRHSAWMRRRSLVLDHIASIGMLLMTLAFTLRILIS